jgi:hypothetical protein
VYIQLYIYIHAHIDQLKVKTLVVCRVSKIRNFYRCTAALPDNRLGIQIILLPQPELWGKMSTSAQGCRNRSEVHMLTCQLNPNWF